ncbi:MAG: 1-deoxy-D-xylulose-5-phosphate reductoisomerase, partial [Oscillospiraceae bacterium]
MKKLSLLGSTGSIGVQTTEVVRALLNSADPIQIVGLAAHSNIKLLERQIREFKPQAVAVFDLQAAKDLQIRVADTSVRVCTGLEGLCEIAALCDADMVLNAVTGMVGLTPTLTAIRERKAVLLANKETLVTGGEIVMREARENQVNILPVDSEHSAIFQCLQGCYDQ